MPEEVFTKFDSMSPNEVFKVAQDSTIALLMDTKEVKELFNEIRTNLLHTIPSTSEKDTRDREAIYYLVKSVTLIEQAMQAKANDYNALRANENDDSVSNKKEGRPV